MFSIIKGLVLPQEELDRYYVCKRKQYYDRHGPVPKRIGLHNAFHWLLLPCIKLLRVANGLSLTVVEDRRRKTRGPVVYACTHIGGTDVETAFEAIRQPCWLFIGDPREVYKNIDGFMLGLNGVICLDSRDREDRRIAKETAVGLLQKGGSLLIFPEGAWNISLNQPVMGLFTGAAEMAIRSGAQIVPVALGRRGKEMYAAVGENIPVAGVWTDRRALTEHLRDAMATLKWDIFEALGVGSRREIPEGYREAYIDSIINDNKETSYTAADVAANKFRDRNVTEPEEAFAHLEAIVPNAGNAFLFNKRLKG